MRVQDNISTFLETVKQTPAQQQQQPVEAPRQVSGSAAARILNVVAANPNGIEIEALYKNTLLDFSEFADVLERLRKLSAVEVVKGPSSEMVSPGPRINEAASLLS